MASRAGPAAQYRGAIRRSRPAAGDRSLRDRPRARRPNGSRAASRLVASRRSAAGRVDRADAPSRPNGESNPAPAARRGSPSSRPTRSRARRPGRAGQFRRATAACKSARHPPSPLRPQARGSAARRSRLCCSRGRRGIRAARDSIPRRAERTASPPRATSCLETELTAARPSWGAPLARSAFLLLAAPRANQPGRLAARRSSSKSVDVTTPSTSSASVHTAVLPTARDDEHDRVDERFARIDLPARSHAQDAGLGFKQAGHIRQLQLLPTIGHCTLPAWDEHGLRRARRGIDRTWQNDPRGERHAGPIRFDPEPRFKLVQNGEASDGTKEMQRLARRAPQLRDAPSRILAVHHRRRSRGRRRRRRADRRRVARLIPVRRSCERRRAPPRRFAQRSRPARRRGRQTGPRVA